MPAPDQTNKPATPDPHTSEAAIERGKKAIEVTDNIHDKDKPEDKKAEDKQKDAEQWRNEG